MCRSVVSRLKVKFSKKVILPSPALPRSKAFPMLVTPSSITEVHARTQHAPSFAVMLTDVRLRLRNQNNVSSYGIFHVLLSYVIWDYFVRPELSASNQWSVMAMATKINYIFMLLLTYFLYYMLEEGEMDPNGKLFSCL